MLQDGAVQNLLMLKDCDHAREAAERLNALTEWWHRSQPLLTDDNDLLADLHRANFELWHLEDRARDRLAAEGTVAAVKRSIDQVNQRRNDLAERVDEALLQHLQSIGLPNAGAPLHSETPGQIFDRLSILALKRFHTGEESRRAEASEIHRERNHTRFLLLTEQQQDLADCMSALWRQVLGGERRFKQYRQLKMYNDPELNPVLYQSAPPRQSP